MERLRLERMVHGGYAIARLQSGAVALVRGGLPNELVEAELTSKGGVAMGAVSRVLEPSDHRVQASSHPGLDYSFIRYEEQLTLKREVVADALQRATKRVRSVPAVVRAPQIWHYRHAVQPAAAADGLGYRHPQSRRLEVLHSDPVAHESINHAWQAYVAAAPVKGVEEAAFRCNDQGEVLLCLIGRASARNYLATGRDLLGEAISGVSFAPVDRRGRFRSGSERLAGKRTLVQRFGRFDADVTATSFAQPNPRAASLLYLQLEKLAGSGQLAVDLYAGSGIIAMHLCESFERVLAVEVDASSVARGEARARRSGLENLDFLRGDVKALAPFPQADLVSVDPPRSGLAKLVRERLLEADVPRLLYVSCDVATWARDVAHFEAGGFELTEVQPFDFYPHTHHIEMLSLLQRRGA